MTEAELRNHDGEKSIHSRAGGVIHINRHDVRGGGNKGVTRGAVTRSDGDDSRTARAGQGNLRRLVSIVRWHYHASRVWIHLENCRPPHQQRKNKVGSRFRRRMPMPMPILAPLAAQWVR